MITNLLAQGPQYQQIEPRANALMRAQQMQDAQLRNALMRQQMQNAQAEMAQRAQQNALMQQAQEGRSRFLNDQAGNMGPPQAFNPAAAMAAGLKPEEIRALLPQQPARPLVGGPGSVFLDPVTRQPILSVPFKEEAPKLPPLGQLQQYRETLPQGDPRRREVDAAIANDTRPPKYATAPTEAAPKPPKPLPAGAVKMQQESLDKIGIAGSINADLGGLVQQIDGGKLSFGPVSNLVNKGLNLAGASTEQSRNLSTFRSTLERLRNESLRLNTGVQTDGDAQRAWNELFENVTDTKLVKQRLQEIQRINERGAELQRLRINSIRAEYGHDPLDPAQYQKQPPAVGGAFQDPDKERRYQEWKAKQGAK